MTLRRINEAAKHSLLEIAKQKGCQEVELYLQVKQVSRSSKKNCNRTHNIKPEQYEVINQML